MPARAATPHRMRPVCIECRPLLAYTNRMPMPITHAAWHGTWVPICTCQARLYKPQAEGRSHCSKHQLVSRVPGTSAVFSCCFPFPCLVRSLGASVISASPPVAAARALATVANRARFSWRLSLVARLPVTRALLAVPPAFCVSAMQRGRRRVQIAVVFWQRRNAHRLANTNLCGTSSFFCHSHSLSCDFSRRCPFVC